MTTTSLLDEAYEQLNGTGPEYRGWLSNHGPMAADAVLRLGHPDELHTWLQAYVRRLEPAPDPRWPIADDEWREPLGDPSRLGDWCALLAAQLDGAPWEQVLARWWTRLLPGAVASATHGLIRTGHAVRALREQVSTARVDELGQALAYWAARWQPLPQHSPPWGTLEPSAALDAGEPHELRGGIRTRLALLAQMPSRPLAQAGPAPLANPGQVPAALDALVDAAVTHYGAWAHGEPVMLVHAATAPRAIALTLPALAPAVWVDSYRTAWAVAAAITTAYRPAHRSVDPAAHRVGVLDDLGARAVESGDEHAIKFAEVALESHRRGNSNALPAAARAIALITANQPSRHLL